MGGTFGSHIGWDDQNVLDFSLSWAGVEIVSHISLSYLLATVYQMHVPLKEYGVTLIWTPVRGSKHFHAPQCATCQPPSHN